MAEKTKTLVRDLPQTAVRIDPDLLLRLNTYCETHRLKPKRNSVIELAIKEFLDNEEAAEAKQRRSA